MSDSEFVPGQRWVSATEAELGLGVVDHLDGRHVILQFPAVGERRTYAVDNAPLGRVRYAVGDQVRTMDGERITVTDLQERSGLIFYGGEEPNGDPILIPELYLDSAVRFSKPQDRLFAGQIDRNSLFDLRAATLRHRHNHRGGPAFGLLGPRIQLLPHQLYIADEVGRRHAPRVLLADEVGLGKTVQAGLIAHQQVISGRASRVLVLLPDTLIHQWLVEMRRRFSMRFTILDERRCEALEESGEDNPFETAQLVISPLSLLASDERRAEQAEIAGWDILIVDEAHHLTWNSAGAGEAYAVVSTLAAITPSVLLLTATPEQLGLEGHFARLRLLDPDRFTDIDAFRDAQAGYEGLRAVVDTVTEAMDLAGKLQPEAREQVSIALATYLPNAEPWPEAVGEEDYLEARLGELLDLHGTGRVLFRNTRASMGGFPARELIAHSLMDEALVPVIDDDVTAVLTPEADLGEDWLRADPRVSWLVEFLGARSAEKTLVICARDETARELEEYLRLREGVRSAVFHRDADLVARDRAAAYFAEPLDGAQVLICSEVGSEGRNFQFARDLVLFDLPRSAELLEQRIGRLDRIGQAYSVRIHVPYSEGSVQHKLLRWYDESLDAFRRPSAVGDALDAQLGDRLDACLLNSADEPFEPLLEEGAQLAADARERLERGRDRLLELNSCRPQQADGVVADVFAAERPGELADYLEKLMDHLGVEQERHDALSVVLKPGEHMVSHALQGLPEEGLTGTYDRNDALAREDLEFLTWEHPLIDGAMEELLASGAGNTALCTLALRALPAGSLLIDARFTVHCAAPRELMAQRFIPDAVIRVLCDESGRDLGAALKERTVSSAARGVRGRTAHELVKAARSRINVLVKHAERLVEPLREPLVKVALEKMTANYGAEIARLENLARVNPHVRVEEIEKLVGSEAVLEVLLEELELTLDGIRVIVITAPD